jgi:hypothetical protein
MVFPVRCISSVSPRFYFRRHAFCFLPLAAILNFEFSKICFETQHVTYTGECSICNWKDCIPMVLSAVLYLYLWNPFCLQCCSVLYFPCWYSFYLSDLSIIEWEVLKCSTIIVLMTVSSFRFVTVCTANLCNSNCTICWFDTFMITQWHPLFPLQPSWLFFVDDAPLHLLEDLFPWLLWQDHTDFLSIPSHISLGNSLH